MHEALSKNLFMVKEHAGIFKAANNYDIYDPETKQIILECREKKLGFITKLLRFTDYKRMTPFHIEILSKDGRTLLTVKRGVTFFFSKVDVLGSMGERLGGFKQKLFTIGGAFDVLGPDDQVKCSLKGKWTGWEFRFIAGNRELAVVSKKWAGVGKELFTSADNYMLSISDHVGHNDTVRELILAAVLCIDMVLKE